MYRRTPARFVLILVAAVLSAMSSWSTAEEREPSLVREQVAEAAAQHRAFLASRTAAERKVPVSVAKRWRQDPETFNVLRTLFSQPSSDSLATSGGLTLYRVDATSIASIDMLMATLGVTPRFVSKRRPYATVELTAAQVQVLAESDDVTRISEVIGPRAKGNAALAHDIDDLSTDNAPGGGNLSGSGVVIGLISLPFSASLLTELEAAAAVPTEASGDLIVLGSAKVTCDPGADPGPDPCAGLTADALNMLQVIHEIAPNAQVVIGSPGSDSESGEMAALIDAMVAGDTGNGVPAAHIILDDLYYPTQNPFEVGEISEAIADARSAGKLYLTAAGDGGHHAETGNTSSVYVANVESVTAGGTAAEQLDPFLAPGDRIHNFGGATLVTVNESLADVCLFSDQNPGFSSALTAWVYDDNDDFVGSVDGLGCLSQDDPLGSLPLASGASIIVLVNTVSGSSRVMLTTERATIPADFAFTSPTMSLTTAGNILGHAYSPDALTVAAADLCIVADAVQSYSDDTACPTISSAPYSADGEGDDVSRFYWQMDSESNWQAIDGGLAASKPSVTAIGTENVQLWNGTALAPGTFTGTSASVAAASGIAAMYWEFRSAAETNAVVLSAEVAAALRDSVTDAGVVGADILFGRGVLDAPMAVAQLGEGDDADKTLFDEPLPVQNLSLTSVVGGVELDFDKAVDDVAEAFQYSVACGDYPSTILFAGDAAGGVENDTKVPKFFAAAGEMSCTVTPRKNSTSQNYDPSAAQVTATAGDVPPVTVTMTAKAGGASFSFTASPLESIQDVSYSASCDANDNPYIGPGWASNPKTDVQSVTPYALQGTAGTAFTCEVTVSVTSGGETYTSDSATASATATAVSAATATFTSDSGGITVGWTPDPNLASADMATGTVVCLNPATGAEVVNQALSGASTFVEAEAGVALSCSVTTVISINEVDQAPTTTSSTTVTPEEEIPPGLPIWMLYQATQGAQATP